MSRRTPRDLHETDFYGWTQRQAALLKAGRFEGVELANPVEETETSGRSKATALEPAYRLICLHQLERILQPERAATRSRTDTVVRE